MDQDRNKQSRSSVRHWLAMCAVVVVGLGLTLGTWLSLRATQEELVRARFERDADIFVGLLQREVDQILEIGRAIRAFYAGSQLVTRNEFDEFAWTYVLEIPDVDAVQWVFPVASDRRDDHESSGSRELEQPYQIVQWHEDKWEAADPADRYLPAYFSVSDDPGRWPVGMDWAAYPRVVQTIENARETGRISFVGPVSKSPGDDGTRSGRHFLAVVPLVPSNLRSDRLEVTLSDGNPEAMRRQTSTSFAIFAFRMLQREDLRERVPVPPGIDLYVVEEVPASDAHLIHSMESTASIGAWRREEVESSGELFERGRLELTDVRWRVHVVSNPVYREAREIHPWVLLALGLLATTGLAAFVFFVMRRNDPPNAASKDAVSE